jgi:hypothetical protein
VDVRELLAQQIDGTRDWTLRLIADLRGDDWGFQPGPGLGHAAWLCGHLAVAQHLLIHVRVLNKPFLDESFAAKFAMGGPVAPLRDGAFLPSDEILAVMADVHARTLSAIRTLDPTLLSEPAYAAGGAAHPHYRDKLGVITHCNRHEAFHAGQIATIRRMVGKSFLR